MPTGARFLLPGACYHLITRGNQRQEIFLDKEDYAVFLSKLKRYKKRYGFLLYGFCLMPNHVHMVGQPRELAHLAKFMQGLCRSYTAHFNKRYKKVGHLWQGRFKSKIIAKDGYLIDCIHYIELNPVRASLIKAAAEYPWSSHRERLLACESNSGLLDKLHL